jgi:hypothetical protein
MTQEAIMLEKFTIGSINNRKRGKNGRRRIKWICGRVEMNQGG